MNMQADQSVNNDKRFPPPAADNNLNQRNDPDSAHPQKTDKRLVFPQCGYAGVLAEFAEAYSQEYESPKEFIYFDLVCLVGDALSARLRVDFGSLMTEPRLYVLKVGKSGWNRKSQSTSIAKRILADSLRNSDVPEIVATVNGAGSAEGLCKALQHNPNTVLVFDEFRRFEKKALIQGSVLAAMACELFDSCEYANWTKGTTADGVSAIDLKGAHLGFLSNTTEDCFYEMTNASEMKDSGLLNRFFVVVAETNSPKSKPHDPPSEVLNRLRDGLCGLFSRLLEKCKDGEVLLELTPGAEKLWDDWYVSLKHTDETARLDSIGMRLMAILTFSCGKSIVDEEIMNSVLAILRYQLEVRKQYRPNEGLTPQAKMQNKIIDLLRRHGEMTLRELRQGTNAHRVGSKIFLDAIAGLRTCGQIDSHPASGRSSPRYFLVEEEGTVVV